MDGATLQRRLAQPARLVWRAARVVATRWETRRVRTLVLDVPDWPGHQAGQHLDLRLTADDGYQAQRSYSIASAPGEQFVELTVERLSDGEVSPYLTDVLAEGDLVDVRGPIGGYFVWPPESTRPLALVAGGSGVVPLACMLRHRKRRSTDSPAALPPARLLYSARSAEDLIYRAEFDTLCDTDRSLRIAYALTRSRPPAWYGYRRRIDREMLEEVFRTPDAATPVFYVCGPTPFVEAAATLLVELGHSPADVLTERFGPTGGNRE